MNTVLSKVNNTITHKIIPDKMPEMNAYMLTILQAKQEFECPAWWIYDHNYRLRVAASGTSSKLHPIYTVRCFTGPAKEVLAYSFMLMVYIYNALKVVLLV